MLSQGERLSLVRDMLDGVIAAVAAAHGVDGVAVVSPERDTVPTDIPLFQDSRSDLNSALSQAIAEARARHIDKVIILPADLPNLASADVRAMVDALQEAACVLAPDRHGTGTNGLCLDLSRLAAREFRFCFGTDSFARHIEEASRRGLSARIVRTPGLEFDLDEPGDLRMLPQQNAMALA